MKVRSEIFTIDGDGEIIPDKRMTALQSINFMQDKIRHANQTKDGDDMTMGVTPTGDNPVEPQIPIAKESEQVVQQIPVQNKPKGFQIDPEKAKEQRKLKKEREKKEELKAKRKERWIIFVLLGLAPIIASVASFFHNVHVFKAGNWTYLAWAIGFAIEYMNFGAILALKYTKQRASIYIAILITTIFLMGFNIWSVYIILHQHMDLVKYAMDLTGIQSELKMMRIISCSQGGILPLISVFYFKMIANFVNQDNSDIGKHKNGKK